MARKNKRYTTEFMESAVKLALSSASICGTAKDLGIPEATLHTWVRKARKTGHILCHGARVKYGFIHKSINKSFV